MSVILNFLEVEHLTKSPSLFYVLWDLGYLIRDTDTQEKLAGLREPLVVSLPSSIYRIAMTYEAFAEVNPSKTSNMDGLIETWRGVDNALTGPGF